MLEVGAGAFCVFSRVSAIGALHRVAIGIFELVPDLYDLKRIRNFKKSCNSLKKSFCAVSKD